MIQSKPGAPTTLHQNIDIFSQDNVTEMSANGFSWISLKIGWQIISTSVWPPIYLFSVCVCVCMWARACSNNVFCLDQTPRDEAVFPDWVITFSFMFKGLSEVWCLPGLHYFLALSNRLSLITILPLTVWHSRVLRRDICVPQSKWFGLSCHKWTVSKVIISVKTWKSNIM